MTTQRNKTLHKLTPQIVIGGLKLTVLHRVIDNHLLKMFSTVNKNC